MEDCQLIEDCCQRLAGSRRGLNALETLLDWLDADGVGLDETNQAAVLTLLRMAWGKHPMGVRDAMRDAIGSQEVNR